MTNWQCPFCSKYSVIQKSKTQISNRFEFGMDNKYGYQAIYIHVTVCANPDCKEYELLVSLHDHVEAGGGWKDLPTKQNWHLIPESMAKVFPSFIPKPLLQDYEEACLILTKSPKAAATLARRCLQGMIRDFWNVKKNRLVDEIDAIQNKVDPDTWKAIDSLRKLGNIGAHMEKDINVIVDVDPDEAELLVKLVETLFEEWYIQRHERQERMAKITVLARQKDQDKKAPPQPAGTEADHDTAT